MGGVIAARYELIELLASGGMAEVWSAIDLKLGRHVALKRVLQELSGRPASLERFEREATAVARLRSPQIVEVYDYGLDAGTPYIIMELLEGEDLSRRLKRLGSLPPAALVSIVEQICRALTAAHTAGLVHRDLKPANVFITEREQLKVLDFGVVSILSDEHSAEFEITREGMMLGTPRYMSPEQVRGAPVDHRSDLWSLAVLAYQALLGTPPFDGRSLGDLVLRICAEPFALPSSSSELDIPRLDAFFARALAKDPAQRFQSASEFSAAFAHTFSTSTKRPLKILFVDDEEDLPFMIEQAFYRRTRDASYELFFAQNGQQALERLREQQDIELLVTDINMPVMDGLALLAQVHELSPNLRSIVVSAYGDMRNVRTAMNRGAFDFLFKPLDFEDLDATIAKASERLSEQREAQRLAHESAFLRPFVSPTLLARAQGGAAPRDVEAQGEGSVVVLGFGGPDSALPAPTLNANFEVLLPLLASHGGSVDRFIGKVAVVVFQADGHLQRVLEACTYARRQLRLLSERWGERSPFGHGLTAGIASGALEWNTVGARAFGRLDFCCCGELVREALRLESLATAGELLVSAEARIDAGTRYAFRPVISAGQTCFQLTDPRLEPTRELPFDNTELQPEHTLHDSDMTCEQEG